MSYLRSNIDAYLDFGSLDRTSVSPMNPSSIRERFLGKPQLFSAFFDSICKLLFDGFHSKKDRRMLTLTRHSIDWHSIVYISRPNLLKGHSRWPMAHIPQDQPRKALRLRSQMHRFPIPKRKSRKPKSNCVFLESWFFADFWILSKDRLFKTLKLVTAENSIRHSVRRDRFSRQMISEDVECQV